MAQRKGLNPKIFYPIIKLSARIFARIDIEQSSPKQAVENTNIPILIVHGNDDRYVPYYMGKEVFEACKSQNKKFLTVDGAGHVISFFKDMELYTKTVNEFIENIM